MGVWLPKHFYSGSSSNPLTLDIGVDTPIPAWAGGPTNDNDGPVSIAYISGSPRVFKVASPQNVWI